jgi:HEAT repeat protein
MATRSILVASVLLLAVRLSAAAEPVAPAEPHAVAVAEVLDLLEHRSRSTVVRRLYGLGAPALPALVDALADVESDSRAAKAVATALARHPRRLVEDAMRSWLASGPGGAARLRVLRGMARFAKADALALAVDIVAGMEPELLGSRRVVGTWSRTLRHMLSETSTRRLIGRGLRDLPESLTARTAEELGRLDRSDTVAALLDLLSRGSPRPELLLEPLTRASPATFAHLQATGILQGHLRSERAPAQAAAAAAAARMGDHALVPELIDALASPHSTVRGAALSALHELTGTTRGVDPAAWDAWLQAESEWLEESGLETRLGAEDPGTVAEALRDAAAHPHAASFALPRIVLLLAHSSAGVRLGAIAVLRAIKRPDGARPLVDALEDPSPGVRRAAYEGLVALTGKRMPPDPVAWLRLLNP